MGSGGKVGCSLKEMAQGVAFSSHFDANDQLLRESGRLLDSCKMFLDRLSF